MRLLHQLIRGHHLTRYRRRLLHRIGMLFVAGVIPLDKFLDLVRWYLEH